MTSTYCAVALLSAVPQVQAQTAPPSPAPSAPIRPTAPPPPGAATPVPGGVTPQPGAPIRPVPALSGAAADRQFAMQAARGGMEEVMAGKLAVQRGSTATVRSLGERMVRDHSKANNQLQSIAKTLGIVLPSSLDADAQTQLQQLKSLDGTVFDRAYITMEVTDHQKAVEFMREESTNGSDASLRAFATQTLPVVEEHLRAFQAAMAESASRPSASPAAR
ncbi:MAG: DUF4142 domain-containing protein [Vulcanimicrobiaceae bacterium]